MTIELKVPKTTLISSPTVDISREGRQHESVDDDIIKSSAKELSKLVVEKRLGMRSNNGLFQTIPVSITPWIINKTLFEQAQQSAFAVADVFVRASEDTNFLKAGFADYPNNNDLIDTFARLLGSHRIAKNINISRQDLLLDKNKQWRLVESNSISAGMGPFCDKLVQAQKTLPINVNNHYVQNPATRLQAKSVFDAAVSLNGNTTPLIVFIVEERENNTFDQALLSDELEHLGARVKYKTLVELRLQLDSSGDSLILSEHGVVDLFYFRTGYNLDDYEFETSNSPNHSQVVTELPLIALRVWIESHRTLVCPSINYQLATSKWMQMKLSSLTVDDLESQLGSSHHIASIAYKTLGTKFFIPDSFDEIRSKLDSKRWLLKTQGEGGGNVFENYSEFEKSQDIKSESLDPYLLMAKIDVAHRQHPVAKLSNGECISHDNVISELGIFTMSSTNDYGGYLLRSKPESQLEAGIHNGDGFLDCLALVR